MKKTIPCITLCLLLVLALIPVMTVSAASAGDFIISGGSGYTFADGVLTVTGGGTYSITGTGTPTTHRIVVTSTADVTLELTNINIDCSSTGQAALLIAEGAGNVTATAYGNYGVTLRSGNNHAGLEKNNGTEKKLTIGGRNSDTPFSATGGINGAGIGTVGSTPCGNIKIISGTVTATGSGNGAGIGSSTGNVSNIVISGGTVTATGSSVGIGSDGGGVNSVTVSGGTVTAMGDNIGIGSYSDNAYRITVSGGTVTVKGGNTGIGSFQGNVDNITVGGDTVTVTGDYVGIGSFYGDAFGINVSDGKVIVSGNYIGIGSNSGGEHNITVSGGIVAVKGRLKDCAVEPPEDVMFSVYNLSSVGEDGIPVLGSPIAENRSVSYDLSSATGSVLIAFENEKYVTVNTGEGIRIAERGTSFGYFPNQTITVSATPSDGFRYVSRISAEKTVIVSGGGGIFVPVGESGGIIGGGGGTIIGGGGGTIGGGGGIIDIGGGEGGTIGGGGGTIIGGGGIIDIGGGEGGTIIGGGGTIEDGNSYTKEWIYTSENRLGGVATAAYTLPSVAGDQTVTVSFKFEENQKDLRLSRDDGEPITAGEYTYSEGVLTILGEGPYTLTSGGNATSDRVAMGSTNGATVTLNGVVIDASNTAFCIDIGTGNVTLLLRGNNVLNGGTANSGLQKNNQSKLTIDKAPDAEGSLTAMGGSYGAGISGNNITVCGGTVVAYGGKNGKAIAVGSGNESSIAPSFGKKASVYEVTAMEGTTPTVGDSIAVNGFDKTAFNAENGLDLRGLKIVFEDVSEFQDVKISLGSDISVNYSIPKRAGTSYTNVRMRFSMNGKTVTVAGVEQGADKYKFVFTGVAPQCMGDTIVAELMDGERVIETKEYSVLTYLNALKDMTAAELKLSQEKYDAMIVLVNDLLVYGGAAQTCVNYKTEALVSNGVTGSTYTELQKSDDQLALANNGTNVTFTVDTLNFKNVNRLKIWFTAEDTEDLVIKYSVGGGEEKEIAFTPDGSGEYLLITPDILALGFDDVFTFTAYKGGAKGATLAYSVRSYVYAMQNSANVKMANLARATYNYGLSAQAFAAES